MPTHVFIALGNILAEQFKKEAEEQEKQQEEQMQNIPNLRSITDLSSLNNLASSIGNGSFNLPNIPGFS